MYFRSIMNKQSVKVFSSKMLSSTCAPLPSCPTLHRVIRLSVIRPKTPSFINSENPLNISNMKILCILAGVDIGVTAYIYHDGSAIQMEKPELKSEIQRERLSDDTMKQIFAERKFRLDKFCEKNHPNRKMKSWNERPSHIYVADVDLGMF